MAEEAHIGQRVRQRRSVYTEEPGGADAARPAVQQQDQQAQQGKQQHHRGIESDHQFFTHHTSFQMGIFRL